MQIGTNRTRPIRRQRRRCLRRGAAIVEFAVVTPLLLALLFGIIEFGWTLMAQQSLTNAVRDACRVGVLQGATDADIQQRFQSSMAGTGIDVRTDMISIEHATTENPVVRVAASVPYSEVSLTGLTSFLRISRASIDAQCSMHMEGM